MSKQNHTISIEPTYTAVKEQFMFHGFECPNCNGLGEIFNSYYGNEIERVECKICKGAKKIKAKVDIEWFPDK